MKEQGSNETKFSLKHNDDLNPIVSKKSNFSDSYLPQWNDEDQRLEESDIRFDRDNEKINVDAKSQFNDTVTIGTDEEQVDLHINGNIYQKGDDYETHAEQLYTKKDHIILREDAEVGLLDDEHSGLIITKYDGTEDLHLCTDNSGYAQVGLIGEATYEYEFKDHNVWYDEETGKYYDDKKFKIEHEFYIPQGAEDVEYDKTEEYKPNGKPTGTYTVTIKYKLTESKLQRLLTVDKNAKDQSILYYDGTSKEARTLETPSDQTDPLVPVLDGGRITYRKYAGGGGEGTANNWSGTQEEFDEAIAIEDDSDENYIRDRSGIDIYDDEENDYSIGVSNKVREGDFNAVTSDAVYKYIEERLKEINGD